MVGADPIVISLAVSGAGALLSSLAELAHARRIRRALPLLRANRAMPAPWTRLLPAVRAVLVAGLTWALCFLYLLPPSAGGSAGGPKERHLVVLLDVSPSMLIKDAGESATLTRANRAAELLTEILNRCPGDHIRGSLVSFYGHPLPLVQASRDRNLLRYMASELPLHILYKPGKTDLLRSLNELPPLLPEMPYRSASLLVLSDGDTVSQTGLKPLPNAFSEVLVLGVGRAGSGTFIDDHNSQQDAASLGTLARRLKGRYLDCNQRPLPLDALPDLTAPARTRELGADMLVPFAKYLSLVCAVLLCLLPVLLDFAGIESGPQKSQPDKAPNLA